MNKPDQMKRFSSSYSTGKLPRPLTESIMSLRGNTMPLRLLANVLASSQSRLSASK